MAHFTETDTERRLNIEPARGRAEMSFDARQWFSYAIPIGFLGLAVALAQTGNSHGTTSAGRYRQPCHDTPRGTLRSAHKMKAGTIDRRFGMTGQDALAAMRDAARLWNSATDIDIVEYGGGTGIPINFVYDDRERLSQDHAAYAATIQASCD